MAIKTPPRIIVDNNAAKNVRVFAPSSRCQELRYRMKKASSSGTNEKTSSSQKQLLMSFYYKGQYKLTKHLYVVAAPGIVNLSYFEFQTGLRYVVPVTRLIGLGIEPAYAFNQKQLVMNVNVHFALK